MYDISILVPAIRTTRWHALYKSIEASCNKYKWQLVLVTPFDLPQELQGYDNIKVIKECGQVSRAVQRGMLELDSELVFLTVDDCTLMENSLDSCIDEYQSKCTYDDVLNVRYSENGDIQPESYYSARILAGTLGGVNKDWQLAPQFIMHKEKFIALGGFDCQFEYINEPVHDFMFRLQKSGGKIYHSMTHCCIASWYESTTGDHAPIHWAQVAHDWPIFAQMYRVPNDRLIIDYDNWKNTPEIWERRFSQGIPNDYTELVKQEGYII
jgi:hypothetical protein